MCRGMRATWSVPAPRNVHASIHVQDMLSLFKLLGQLQLSLCVPSPDTMFHLCSPDTRSTYHDVQALAHAIRLHEKNQRLFVKHKGVDFLMAIMNKWEEDHDFYFLMLRALRVRVR